MLDRPPTSPDAESPDWQRLHPSCILIDVTQRVLKFAWFIAIAVLLLVLGDKPNWFEYTIAAIALIEVLSPVLTYLSLRFAIVGGQLVLRTGLIFRRDRTINLNRIQNVNLKRGLAHRVFGVTALTVETAVSGKAEVELSAIAQEDAERLRIELLLRRGAVASTGEAPEPESIWRASSADLMILGLTENRLPLILGALGSLWWTFDDVLEPYWDPARAVVTQLAGANRAAALTLAFVLVLAMLLLASLISIVLSYARYHGFTLRRLDDRLGRQHGLFTRHETLLPVSRVQAIRIEQPWLRRLLGFASIHAETAGGFVLNQDQGTIPLCPLVRRGRAAEFVGLAFERVRLDDVPWESVSRHTIGRAFVRCFALLVVVLCAIGFWWTWRGFYVLPVGIVLAALYARVRYRALGYAEVGGYLFVRGGVLNHRVWVIPRAKLQSLTESQSPNQRRFGIANLVLAKAGGNRLEPTTIIDIEHTIATALEDRLSLAANQAGGWPVDGV